MFPLTKLSFFEVKRLKRVALKPHLVFRLSHPCQLRIKTSLGNTKCPFPLKSRPRHPIRNRLRCSPPEDFNTVTAVGDKLVQPTVTQVLQQR